MANPLIREIDVFQKEPIVFRLGEGDDVGLIIGQKDNDGKPIDHTVTTITDFKVTAWEKDDPDNPVVQDEDLTGNEDLNYTHKGKRKILLPYSFDATSGGPFNAVGEYIVVLTFTRDTLLPRKGEIFVNVVKSDFVT